MNDRRRGATGATGAPAALFSILDRVTERDRTEQVETGRNPERLAKLALTFEDTEEQGTQTCVLSCQQQRHHGH